MIDMALERLVQIAGGRLLLNCPGGALDPQIGEPYASTYVAHVRAVLADVAGEERERIAPLMPDYTARAREIVGTAKDRLISILGTYTHVVAATEVYTTEWSVQLAHMVAALAAEAYQAGETAGFEKAVKDDWDYQVGHAAGVAEERARWIDAGARPLPTAALRARGA